MFDSITPHDLLTAAGFLVFITIYIVGTKYTGTLLSFRLSIVDATIQDFKREIEKLAAVITEQARQDLRITTQDDRLLHEGKRVDELERRVNRFQELVNGRMREEMDKWRVGMESGAGR